MTVQILWSKLMLNMSNDSESTKPPLVFNSLDIPTLDKCPNKELRGTIVVNNTENTTHILNYILFSQNK